MIVDDEQLSIERLERLLRDSGLATVEGRFTDPAEALEYLKDNTVDAAFLDIEMPDLDGIELSGHVLELRPEIAVVFVTAYNQYAVEAFRLNALDYLMKPITAERLAETIHRIKERRGPAVSPTVAQVRCFGRFSVRAGQEVVKFRTEKAEELLAFLIDKRAGFVSRREIIDSLWEDFDGDRALIHFNTTLHYLKKALLSCGIEIQIIYDRGGYRLGLGALSCDYLEFCGFLTRDESIKPTNILQYERAARLPAEEYLSGWEHDWVGRRRLLLEEQHIQLLLAMADYYRQVGNYQQGIDWLQAGLINEPLHRELNYRLVELLLLANERALATKHYNLYRRDMQRKLNQAPDQAFARLLR